MKHGISKKYMHDISKKWSCEVMWQIKYLSLPAEDVSTPHYARCWLKVQTLWSSDQGEGSQDFRKYIQHANA